jgi:hypothetical protein
MDISQVHQPLNINYAKAQFEKCITLKSTIAMGKIANNSSPVALSFTCAKWERGHMGPTRWGVEASNSLPHRFPKSWPVHPPPLDGCHGYRLSSSSCITQWKNIVTDFKM